MGPEHPRPGLNGQLRVDELEQPHFSLVLAQVLLPVSVAPNQSCLRKSLLHRGIDSDLIVHVSNPRAGHVELLQLVEKDQVGGFGLVRQQGLHTRYAESRSGSLGHHNLKLKKHN